MTMIFSSSQMADHLMYVRGRRLTADDLLNANLIGTLVFLGDQMLEIYCRCGSNHVGVRIANTNLHVGGPVVQSLYLAEETWFDVIAPRTEDGDTEEIRNLEDRLSTVRADVDALTSELQQLKSKNKK